MGNSKSGVDFAIKLDKEFYLSNQYVKGHLFLNTKKRFPCDRIILEVEGIESCEFRTVQGATVTTNRKNINTSYVLAQFGHNQFLDGQLDLPFSFKFLQYLPGSFQQNSGQYKAKVSYNIKAIITSKDKKTTPLEKTMEVIIREPQRQGQRMLQGQTYATYRSCFCLDKGVSRIYCYFQKNYYLPGEECIMICEADNTKCEEAITQIKCQFMKEVVLIGTNGSKRVFTQLLNTVFFPGIGAKASYFGEDAKRQSLMLMQKASKRDIKPSTHGHYVSCQYYILVEPIFGGCFGKAADSQFKVYLTILQRGHTYEPIERPQDWRPSIGQTANFYLNMDPYSSNQQLSSMRDFSY